MPHRPKPSQSAWREDSGSSTTPDTAATTAPSTPASMQPAQAQAVRRHLLAGMFDQLAKAPGGSPGDSLLAEKLRK